MLRCIHSGIVSQIKICVPVSSATAHSFWHYITDLMVCSAFLLELPSLIFTLVTSPFRVCHPFLFFNVGILDKGVPLPTIVFGFGFLSVQNLQCVLLFEIVITQRHIAYISPLRIGVWKGGSISWLNSNFLIFFFLGVQRYRISFFWVFCSNIFM